MSTDAVSATKTVTIYALTDPDSGEVRYVGKTKNIWKRYAGHLMMTKGTSAKHGWFLDLQQRQQMPALKILAEAVEPIEANALEQQWIQHYHGQGVALVNVALIPRPPKAPKQPTPHPSPSGTLAHLLKEHGIPTIREFARRMGFTRQQAWDLWHARVGVGTAMMRRMHETLGIPLEDLIQLDHVSWKKRPKQKDPGSTSQRSTKKPTQGKRKPRPKGKGDRS